MKKPNLKGEVVILKDEMVLVILGELHIIDRTHRSIC